MNKKLTNDEILTLFEIATQRAHLKPDKSYALPLRMYRNPELTIKLSGDKKKVKL